MQSTIREILARKGSSVHTVPIGTSVRDAARTMSDHRVGSVVVMNGEQVAGILTERDVARRVVFRGLDPDRTPVDEVMTSKIASIEPSTKVGEAMHAMAATHCRHLPVVLDHQLVGLVSLGDLVRALTRDYDLHVRYLESYIRGI